MNASPTPLPPAFRLTPDHAPTRLTDHLSWLDANRLAPAAARVLANTPLPDDARAHLDDAYAQARAQWLLRKTALQRFLALMAREPALPVILLKGAALALTLYDDPAIRPMNDIDWLVRPGDMPEVLSRMRESYDEAGLAPGEDVGYLHHFIFTDPATGVRIEPHRTLPLLPGGGAGLDWFLGQTEPHEFEGLPFLVFTPEAQLLHLAAHAMLEHGGPQGAVAIWLYDIDQLIRRWGAGMDWDMAIDRAQALAWEAALQQAILMAREFFETPIPAAIKAWLQLPSADLSGYNILRSMTAGGRSSSLTVFHILRSLSWSQRIRQLSHMLFPSIGYMKGRYPAIPWPLAYPYRWFDSARKLLPALLWK